MDPGPNDSRFTRARLLFLGLSVLNVLVCAIGASLHYLKRAWGNPAHLVGWLLSILFLLLAFSPSPRQIGASLKSSLNAKTGFFTFWIAFFIASHLWHFSRAPWNGNGLFDESGWDLWFLKSYVIGHPFQPAWFHSPISRETLFHYYLLPFFSLFGYNILAYEIGLFVIWGATFLFTLLLVDLLFESRVVTTGAGLVFNFLPFAFVYTFAGYRYPMATALCVASLYFLYRGFRRGSSCSLSLGGLFAGLCLASSISGKQYLVVLLLCAVLYPIFGRGPSRWTLPWRSVGIIAFSWLVGATPILCYIVFNRNAYTLYENSFIQSFWQAVRGNPAAPNDLASYLRQFWDCFFHVPGNRFFIPDVLPIPLPYFVFLMPGIVLALWKKRFEIVLLGTVPVAGALIATAYENRLLLAIPFWVVLMAFSFAAIVKARLRSSLRLPLLGIAAAFLLAGLVPSIRYIKGKARNPFTIHHYAQEQVAVSRFLRLVVAGKGPVNPPRLERDEFNRVRETEPSYDTFICQKEAYSIIHLFLRDYDDDKILSFSNGLPFNLMSDREIWAANKIALATYVPKGKDLKLIWETDPKLSAILQRFQSLGELVTEESMSFSFAGRERKFYVLNIRADNLREFQERVRGFPVVP